MNWDIWAQVENTLLELGVKPVMAVVPDNHDEKLKICAPDHCFWDKVRNWQGRGWTIGLHGYQHLYVTRDAGLLGVNRSSEFSGLSYAEQKSKLRQALDIFNRERVIADLWVAPGHSFDKTTIQVLFELGIQRLSDGFSLYPYLDSGGMMWVPQQLWRFRKMPFGLWTVCLHLNSWTAAEVPRFRSELSKFAGALTDWPSTIAAYQSRKHNILDTLFSGTYQIALRGRRWLR
jgi:predicted deacetylase